MNWVAILIALASIPLSILANLLTPSIKDWLAVRSERRLLRRLGTLEKKLKRLKRGVRIDDIFDHLFVLFVILGGFALAFAFYITSILLKDISEGSKEGLRLLSLYIVSGIVGAAYAAFMKILRDSSLKYEEKIEKKIVSLKAKYEKRFGLKENTAIEPGKPSVER